MKAVGRDGVEDLKILVVNDHLGCKKMDAMRKTGSDFETTCLLWMMTCDLQLVSQ